MQQSTVSRYAFSVPRISESKESSHGHELPARVDGRERPELVGHDGELRVPHLIQHGVRLRRGGAEVAVRFVRRDLRDVGVDIQLRVPY